MTSTRIPTEKGPYGEPYIDPYVKRGIWGTSTAGRKYLINKGFSGGLYYAAIADTMIMMNRDVLTGTVIG